MNVAKFISFLGKYANEAASIGGALSAILPALPLGKGDKEKVQDTIDQLTDIPNSIAKAIGELKKAPTVVIKKADIEAVVTPLLPALIEKALNDREKGKGK